MIQVKNVVDAIYGAIGWRQNLDNDNQIYSSLTESRSGLYYQDAHPLLTLNNLLSIAPDTASYNFKAWNNADTYAEKAIVSYNDELYKAVSAVPANETPSSDSSYWTVYDPFSAWLEEKTRASIANAITHFISSAMPNGGTKSILEHRLLFDSVTRIKDKCKNADRLVGLEVHPIHNYDACVKLEKVMLQAINVNNHTAEGTTQISIKSSQDMYSLVDNPGVVIGRAKSTPTVLNNVVLDCKLGGNAFYVFYDQQALNNQGFAAINRTIDWSKAPCRSCNSNDYLAYLAWSKYIEVWPFIVARSNIESYTVDNKTQVTFDQQDMSYTNLTNWGLNIELSVYCDYTDFLIRHQAEFYTLIMKQVAVDMLKEFMYNANVRANRNSVNASRLDVVSALDGNPNKQGLYAELEMMYKGLNVSTKGLDSVCKPCANHGLRYIVT